VTRPGKDRLGKGLGALLGDYMDEPRAEGDIRKIPLGSIVPNPMQPRQEFSEAELAELAESIRENGLLQPLLVRPAPGAEGRYELVAGERRLRSIQQLDWDSVPVVVRDVDDESLLVLALVENLQREELNPLEEAEGYQALADRFDLTQEQIAHAVGKNRSTVANVMRLLRLPPSIRKMLRQGELSMGHARALLSLADPMRAAEIARLAVSEGWSVRDVEKKVREASKGGGRRKRKGDSDKRDPVLQALEEALQVRLGTRVRIRRGGKGSGSIDVPFHDSEDFERLFALITGSDPSEVVG
jgi:ParB family transcriptional regulator, chromosome partitioning protein